MGQGMKPPEATPKLRGSTKAMRSSKVVDSQGLSLDELRALVHELEVQRIELARQNDELHQSQTSLKEACKKYRDFFNFAPVGFLTLDESGMIRDVNLTAVSQLGVARDHLINKPFHSFIKTEDRDRFRLCLEAIFREPGPQPCEMQLERHDGKNFFARLDRIAVTDVSGERACRAFVTDISELKQTEQKLRDSERLFASFMEHLPSVAVIRDLEGRYLFANAAWEQAFHKTREKWLGKTTEDLWPAKVAEKFKAQDRQVLETGEALQSLGPLPHPDGQHQWISYRFPLVDQEGRPVMIGISAIDVTEHLETQARLERLLASGPAAMYTCEPRGDFTPTYQSENVKALVGWEARDFLADSSFWLDHLHPDDRPRILKQLEFPWPDDHRSLEYRFLAKDGAYRWMHDELKLVRDQDGEPVEIAGAWMDITARRQMEQELKEAHNRLQTLIQAAPLPIAAVDRDGRITQWNPAAERTFGWSKAEVMGRPNPIVPPERQEHFRQILGRLLAGESFAGLELPSHRKDDSLLDIRLSSAPLYDSHGDIIGAMAVMEDITAQKQVQEALKESENQYRLLVNQIPAVVFKGYQDWSIDFFDQKVKALTGYRKGEFDSRQIRWCDLILPEDLDKAHRIFSQALKREKSYVREYRIRKKDGEIRWIQARGQIFCDKAGKIDYVNGVLFDITEGKVAETILQKERQRFFSLLDMLPAPVSLVAPDFTLQFANHQFREIFGDPQGRTCYELAYGRQTPCDNCNAREILETQKPAEWERTTPQGRTYQVYNYPFADIDGSPMLLKLGMDITARKALEAQLLQAQKMEAVGRLAGGVAHDFNNLLMAIMGYGELIRTSLVKDDPLYKYSEDILRATERAASLTQQLLAFSRRQVMQPQVLNLNRVTADLERMLRRLIGEHIDMEIVADPDLWAVKADPGQINQIIMNLAVNALDAMPTGGRLILSTANIDFVTSHNGRFENTPPGRYVRLTVSDSGSGMDAETLDHIFEPFFTTKEVGKGTGLGLPMVYGIVKQNYGYIEVESQPGQGTTFKIYLPRLDEAVEARGARISPAARLEGSETILVVEDEEALRTLLCRFFRLYGYNVLEARHGGEALLICEQYRGPIHLMVTDVVMPQMSGKELADRLAPLHPEMTVFFMSGYTDSDLTSYGAPEPSQHFIPKPFRPMDLVKKVRDILDASPAIHV